MNKINRSFILMSIRHCNAYSLVEQVADFGLSRVLREAYYLSKTSKPLPIRWMPLEAVYYSKFSTASDIWSFGVVLWYVRL
jgi:serine/threonine protein kinase